MISAADARTRVTTAVSNYDTVWTNNQEDILAYVDTVIKNAADYGYYSTKVALSPSHVTLFKGEMLATRIKSSLQSSGYTVSICNQWEVSVSWSA